MTKFRVNFSAVEEFTPIPSGVYKLVVTDFEEREGPSAPYIAFTFEIDEGEYAGRKLWDNISMSPKAAFKVKEFCVAMGENSDNLVGEFDFDPEAYLGAQCRGLVVQETYEGKIVNRIDQLLPPAIELKTQKMNEGIVSNQRQSSRRIIR